jgi:hypothetical protein
VGQGFGMVTPGNDVGLLVRAAREAVSQSREASHGSARTGTGY